MSQDSKFNNCEFVSKDNEPLSLARLLGNILFDSDSEHQEPIKQDHSKEGETTNCRSSKNGSSSDDHGVGVDPAAVVGAGHIVSTVVLGKIKMQRHLYNCTWCERCSTTW